MGEQKPEKTKKHICAGLLAHVTAEMPLEDKFFEIYRETAGEIV